MNKMVVLAFGLEPKKFSYLHSIFIQDVLVAAEINVFGEMLWKLSGVEILSKWFFCFGPVV